MKITKDGSKLTVSLDSGIGYTVPFSHDCGSESNAEAWRRHLQTQQDLDTFARQHTNDTHSRIVAFHARQRAALRGHITRLKRRLGTP